MEFGKTETENIAVHFPRDARHELIEHSEIQGIAFSVQQRDRSAAVAGPPGQAHEAVATCFDVKRPPGLPTVQRGEAAFARLLAARIGISGEHGPEKIQTGGFARLVAAQKDAQAGRQGVDRHV